MPVLQVQDAGGSDVIPPNTSLKLDRASLRLSARGGESLRGPVDRLFKSVADESHLLTTFVLLWLRDDACELAE